MKDKRTASLYMSDEVLARLRLVATEMSSSESAVADIILHAGLTLFPVATLHRMMAKRRRDEGGAPGSKAERACVAAINSLLKSPEGATRFELAEVADKAGLLRKGAWLALNALQGRGLVEGAHSPELDRWGRPVRSFWSKK